MVKASAKRFPVALVGECVLVPIPQIDRAKTDLKNAMAIINSFNDENDMYKLGTKYGSLKSLYARNQFKVVNENFLDKNAYPDAEINLREYARRDSLTGAGIYELQL